MKLQIGIIGAGHMGAAFYHGLLQLFPAESLCIADHNPDKLKALGAKHYSLDAEDVFQKADIIIFAIKPQAFRNLNFHLQNKLVISIMAGISLAELFQKTRALKIVRSMPNLPVQIGKGVIGWISSGTLIPEEKVFIKKIFSPLGYEVELAYEDQMNALTALSGSGPAYFFTLCEMMAKKAREFGFSPEISRIIAEQTFIGSADLLAATSNDAASLRAKVTSRGGTTEAALKILEKSSFEADFFKALETAQKRSAELSH